MEELKSKNLQVRVAHALVNPVTATVPLRLLNLSSDATPVFKGTKVTKVKECDTLSIAAMNVNTDAEKIPKVPKLK